MSAPHQAIHVPTMLKLRFPTGVPAKPGDDCERQGAEQERGQEQLGPTAPERPAHHGRSGKRATPHRRTATAPAAMATTPMAMAFQSSQLGPT